MHNFNGAAGTEIMTDYKNLNTLNPNKRNKKLRYYIPYNTFFKIKLLSINTAHVNIHNNILDGRSSFVLKACGWTKSVK